MSTNLQSDNYQSKQVRVSAEWHQKLKQEANNRGIVISKLLAEICRQYFENVDKNPP